MSSKWAQDEAKLGFSGPPSEIGWADHEEVVGELKDALKDIERRADDAINNTPTQADNEAAYVYLRSQLILIWEKARRAL